MYALRVELFRIVLLMVTSVFCGGCDAANTPPPDSGLPIATVSVRADESATPVHVEAEIASTTAQRQQGLMHREEMSENRGMLFLFAQDVSGGFWMKNTILPLTIAYISADGVVLELRTGEPFNETVLRPAQPYRYVLEVNQGWFERHGLGVGSLVEIPPGLPTPQ